MELKVKRPGMTVTVTYMHEGAGLLPQRPKTLHWGHPVAQAPCWAVGGLFRGACGGGGRARPPLGRPPQPICTPLPRSAMFKRYRCAWRQGWHCRLHRWEVGAGREDAWTLLSLVPHVLGGPTRTQPNACYLFIGQITTCSLKQMTATHHASCRVPPAVVMTPVVSWDPGLKGETVVLPGRRRGCSGGRTPGGDGASRGNLSCLNRPVGHLSAAQAGSGGQGALPEGEGAAGAHARHLPEGRQ